MKTFIFAAAALLAVTSVSSLQAQEQRRARSGAAASPARQRTFTYSQQRTDNTVTITPVTDGAVLRATRNGNALQLVNPGAPASYGSGQEVARHEDGDPYQRPQGIKLFVFNF